jgi:hypothetical protein
MHVILDDKVNFQNFSSLDYSKYIPVHTRMYRYRYRLQQSHIKALYWTRLIKFHYFLVSILHWSMDGQVQLLKHAEKDQVE